VAFRVVQQGGILAILAEREHAGVVRPRRVPARRFHGRPLPDLYDDLLGPERRCFTNVARASAARRELVPYLGLAVPDPGAEPPAGRATRSVAHAWLADEAGEVVDVTDPWHLGWGARYVGAPAAHLLEPA
jgi:hypothetical protein